jgi:lipoprotein
MYSKLLLGAVLLGSIALSSCNCQNNGKSCGTQQAETTVAVATEKTQEKKTDAATGATISAEGVPSGRFEGKLPGADVADIMYTMVFNADGTCNMTATVEGVEPLKQTGKFTCNATGKPQITCTFENDAPYYFNYNDKHELILVNEEGTEAEISEDYVLKPVKQ